MLLLVVSVNSWCTKSQTDKFKSTIIQAKIIWDGNWEFMTFWSKILVMRKNTFKLTETMAAPISQMLLSIPFIVRYSFLRLFSLNLSKLWIKPLTKLGQLLVNFTAMNLRLKVIAMLLVKSALRSRAPSNLSLFALMTIEAFSSTLMTIWLTLGLKIK